jgi:hypothetical protein
MERQRERIATLQGGRETQLLPARATRPKREDAPPPPNETATAAALRIARAHPVATGVVAAAAAMVVIRPKRLLRWSAVHRAESSGACAESRKVKKPQALLRSRSSAWAASRTSAGPR